jgi:uncharacterized surface protein with fasciclin (FAS1) repeats
MVKSTTIAGLLLGALALPGCSNQTEDKQAEAAGAQSAGEKNLADALGKQPDLTTLAAAIKATGLNGVFANAGSYTLLAPNNAAFAKLGDKAAALNAPEQRAALTAVVRDHMVPGYLTRDDIAKAIEAGGGKPVKMRTLGAGELSFAKDGTAITVTAADGASATIAGTAVPAGPSIALPVDGVLKKV